MLGLVLGDIVDKSLRRGLVLSDGSLLPFFTRPISAALAALVLLMLLAQIPALRQRFAFREGAVVIDRLSLCNEVLAPWGFAEQCAYAAKLGYRGLEVAPFTLAADPTTISDAQAARWAAIARDHGLAISGLHWLLVAPSGLSISSPDAAVRHRTRAVIERLIELCAQLGGSYLVHGSPAQRNPQPGQSVADALARATEAWVAAGEWAGRFGVTYCIEPLARDQTPVVNTVAEAVGDRRGRGAAESEDDARHQFGRRDGSRAAAGADRSLVAERAPCARAAQRPQPARPRTRRRPLRADPRGARAAALRGLAGHGAVRLRAGRPRVRRALHRLRARAARGGS